MREGVFRVGVLCVCLHFADRTSCLCLIAARQDRKRKWRTSFCGVLIGGRRSFLWEIIKSAGNRIEMSMHVCIYIWCQHTLYIDCGHTLAVIFTEGVTRAARGVPLPPRLQRHGSPSPPPALILSFAPVPVPSVAARGHKRHALQSVLVLHLSQDAAASGSRRPACTETAAATKPRRRGAFGRRSLRTEDVEFSAVLCGRGGECAS